MCTHIHSVYTTMTHTISYQAQYTNSSVVMQFSHLSHNVSNVFGKLNNFKKYEHCEFIHSIRCFMEDIF